ncbi:hypothetical protein [Argonema galeatum]|uniref:hypothetical protein n=1 Tax=Argonema galeatum TaxID=2942762 RepID=UPI00201141F2|nr:hypothetical protein [Argonema galeatum]MCL1465030.1 hypothetical protein [Argonema galeatum A003/A1]
MTDIKVEIQGQDAAAATEALLAIPGISGSWEPIAGTRRETVLATVATIVGLVGGNSPICLGKSYTTAIVFW